MNYNKLDKYKKFIIRDRKFTVLLIVLGAYFLCISLWAAFYSLIGLVIALIPLSIILFAVRWLIEDNRLLKQLLSIEANQVLNKTYVVNLQNPETRFMQNMVIRKYTPVIRTYYGVTVTDKRKNKYYYFFDENTVLSKSDINAIRKKLNNNIQIQCYENTSVIKTFENNKWFLSLK